MLPRQYSHPFLPTDGESSKEAESDDSASKSDTESEAGSETDAESEAKNETEKSKFKIPEPFTNVIYRALRRGAC